MEQNYIERYVAVKDNLSRQIQEHEAVVKSLKLTLDAIHEEYEQVWARRNESDSPYFFELVPEGREQSGRVVGWKDGPIFENKSRVRCVNILPQSFGQILRFLKFVRFLRFDLVDQRVVHCIQPPPAQIMASKDWSKLYRYDAVLSVADMIAQIAEAADKFCFKSVELVEEFPMECKDVDVSLQSAKWKFRGEHVDSDERWIRYAEYYSKALENGVVCLVKSERECGRISIFDGQVFIASKFEDVKLLSEKIFETMLEFVGYVLV
jgi:hypothetical protein